MSKLVMVTGVSSGIGLAVARRMLKDSHRVVGLSRRNVDESVLPADRFTHEYIDLGDLNQLSTALPELATKYAEVDGIVFCAGYGKFGNLEENSFEQIADMVNTNLLSTILLTRVFLPQMKQRGEGSLVYIGSESVLSGGRRGAVYTASKSGMDGFVKSLRKECSANAIHVGIVTPGMVKTEFYDQAQFTHGDSPDNYVVPEDVAESVAMMLDSRRGTVIDSIVMTPLKSVITRRQKD